MARTPSFDRNEVLQKAMEVFWADGYASSTMQSLGKAMGLQPGSIYAAFGGKDALFRAALARYVSQVRSQIDGSLSPRESISLWFEQHVERACVPPRGRGCLLLNSIAENQALDQESADLVLAELSLLKRFFTSRVRKIRSQEGRSERQPANAVAESLVVALCGISVLSRAGTDKRALRKVARVALDAV